jgi:cytoskeletal protein RodZ
MSLSTVSAGKGEGRLWAIALGLSLMVNVAILGLAGFAALKTHIFRKSIAVPIPAPLERVAMIFPQQASPSAELLEKRGNHFARTSEEQTSAPPKKSDFIGKRDTTATSDRAPDPNAPPLPAQAGVERFRENDLETTESDYQDGRLNQENTPKSPLTTEASPPRNATDRRKNHQSR